MSGFVTGKVANLTRVLLTQEAPHPRQLEKRRRTVPLEYRVSLVLDDVAVAAEATACCAAMQFPISLWYMTGHARVAVSVSPLHLKCSFVRKHEGSSPC